MAHSLSSLVLKQNFNVIGRLHSCHAETIPVDFSSKIKENHKSPLVQTWSRQNLKHLRGTTVHPMKQWRLQEKTMLVSCMADSDKSGADNNNMGDSIPSSGWFDIRAGDNSEPNNSLKSSEMEETASNGTDGSELPPVWDFAGRRKKFQEAASKMSDPFRDMVSTASQKLQDYLDKHKVSSDNEVVPHCGDLHRSELPADNSNWKSWLKVIEEVEQKYLLLSALQFQLEEAVSEEDYKKAGKLKAAFDECAVGDPMATSLAEIDRALKDEYYGEVARIRDQTSVDLIGWWSGLSEGVEDPFGRIVNISPIQGRLVAKSYSAKHLSKARPGLDLFEIFVRKTEGGNYENKPVYLQRKQSQPLVQALQNPVMINADKGPIQKLRKPVRGPDAVPTSNPKDSEDGGFSDSEDNLQRIVELIRSRLPDLRSQVIQVMNPTDLSGDPQKAAELLLKKIAEAAAEGNKTQGVAEPVKGENEANNTVDDELEEGIREDGIDLGNDEAGFSGSSDFKESDGKPRSGRKELRVELGMSDLAESMGFKSSRMPESPERVSARIERLGKNEFLFHVEGEDGDAGALKLLSESQSGQVKISASVPVAVESSSDKAVGSDSDSIPLEKWNLDRIAKLALLQSKRNSLSRTTKFKRINVDNANADPLSGLYIGAFGPYSSEVVQLSCKFGKWDGDTSDSAPYEYVEARKLTGDMNVPAGQVTFRARIGRNQRLSSFGVYPQELGVTCRYKGEGRLAEQGFKNPRWIDGELILLDGKIQGQLHGAELGFVYSVPERHFLVLFNRLKLKN